MDLVRAVGERREDPARPVLGGYDWAELDRRVEERATALDGGAVAGRIHPFVMESGEEGIVALLALWRRGATAAPLNPRLTDAELRQARAALEGQDGGGAQVVLWTSGTSGRPRGVALGWDGLTAHVTAVQERLALDPQRDVWLATLPPAHVGGFMLLFRALLTASPVVAPPTPSAPEIVEMLDGGVELAAGRGPRPVTHLSLVPTQFLRLLELWGDRPVPAGLRCLLLGGARTPASVRDRALAAGWPLALTWGMTEMASQVATAPPTRVRAKPGTVGRPLEGVEVRVAEDGELLVRSPAAALALLDGTPLLDDDGWYHTGDLGGIDDEGDLWITGRRSDRIVSGGVTVDATEVEEVVLSHPSVHGVCVVGLPDPEWGERVAAWVIPVEGEFEREALDAWLRERLSPAKRPRLWRVGGGIPRNATGKMDRSRVRAALGDLDRG